MAIFVPNIARALLRVAKSRGYPLAPFCRGLGFRPHNLVADDLRLSYKQTRDLVLRVLRTTNDPALGIATGACQTPQSWGVVGLGLLTCKTLGEALLFGLRYQFETGAMLVHRFVKGERTVTIEVAQKYADCALEPFLVEESFASILAVGRYLANPALTPLRIELAFSAKGHELACSQYFLCPVVFGAIRNQMIFDVRWLDYHLPGYDAFTCESLQRSLVDSFPAISHDHELVSSLASQINNNVDQAVRQGQLASAINISDRTMRRRLKALGTSFRQVEQGARYEQAVKLMRNPDLSITDISEELGYSNVRAFRRAFQRWAGMLPSAYREKLMAERFR